MGCRPNDMLLDFASSFSSASPKCSALHYTHILKGITFQFYLTTSDPSLLPA
jgi:hypothetical protein